MNVEMLYDDVAMENTHFFLISADNNLKQAKNNYDSSKLTGDKLVTDAETFMKEIEPYLASYNNATEKIYTGASNSNGMNIQAKGSSQIVESIKKLDFSKKSADSIELQEKLELLGYDIGASGVDGIIGQNTLSALKEFLAAKLCSIENGSTDDITIESFDIFNYINTHSFSSTDDITIEIFELLRSCFKDMINKLKDKIDKGEATDEEKIKYTQIVLKELGYYPATEGINGSANPITEYAVMTYCVSNGIEFSSVNITNMELSFLKQISEATKTYAEVKQERLEQIKSGKVDLDMSSKNQRIEIQLMLKASGYYTGAIDGEFGDNIEVALRHICEDRGLCSPDMTVITDWSQITLETFAVIATTDKRGLEEFKRSDENDKTFMGAVLDVKRYFATHGFKYCMDCSTVDGKIVRKVIISDSSRICTHKKDSYVTDCSTAVTAYLYYYAEANGSKTMMKEFNQQKNSTAYVNVVENDGYINGVKYFEVVSQEELQEGDILVKNGHVEVYAGSMANETEPNVYNAGTDTSVAASGITESSHSISGYSILRPISPEEVKKIDNAN